MIEKSKDLRLKIIKYSNYIEIYIAIFILIGILIVSVNTINNFVVMVLGIFDSDVQSVIDVLLFAIARKIIVETATSFDLVLSILSIAILFLIRKYVYKKGTLKE